MMASGGPRVSLWDSTLYWMEKVHGKRLNEDKKGTLNILLNHLDVLIDEVASVLEESFVPLNIEAIEHAGLEPLIIPNKLFPLFGPSYILQSEASGGLKSVIKPRVLKADINPHLQMNNLGIRPDPNYFQGNHDNGLYTCIKCSSVHDGYDYLVNHLQNQCAGNMSQGFINHNIADRTCKNCSKTFASLNYLKFYHSEKCESSPIQPLIHSSLKCNNCSKVFSTVPYFYYHFRTCMSSEPTFQKLESCSLKDISCNKCGFIANSKEEFQTMDHNCEPNKRYKCLKCDFQTYHPSSLRNHDLAIHHKDNPLYRCNICGASYSYKTGFNRHLKTHLEKPSKVPCPHCNKYFSGRSSLNRHIKSHHKSIQQHPCQLCGKTYLNLRYLKRHIKSQHPETGQFEKHECAHCHSFFREKAYLKKHIRKQHSDL